jgi:CRP-like cAMP-binding protein
MAKDVDALKRVSLLSGLAQRHLKRLAEKARERQFKAGTTVIEEGKMSGIGFFVIAAGEASVRAGGRELARLGPGDHFGELALIGDGERTATVTAETALECLEITAWDFRDFVKSDAEGSWKLLQHVVDLLLEPKPSPARASD